MSIMPIAMKLPNNAWNAVRSMTLKAYEAILRLNSKVLFSVLPVVVYSWYVISREVI